MVTNRTGWSCDTGTLGFLPYGKEFNDTRKIFQKGLSNQCVATFQEAQLRQTLTLARNILESPEDFEKHIQQ